MHTIYYLIKYWPLQKPKNNYLTTLQRAAYVKALPCMKLLPHVTQTGTSSLIIKPQQTHRTTNHHSPTVGLTQFTVTTWHWTVKHHFYTKTFFQERNMTFPLIYNLTDLIDKLQDLNILTQLGQLLPQHLWLHLIIHQRQVYITTLLTRLLLATRCLICLILTGTIDLTLTIWLKTVTFLKMAILFTSRQAVSLWVVTIIDK